jgi:hypothetical protein
MRRLWLGVVMLALMAFGVAGARAQAVSLLTREEAAKILPATVFFRGQTAGVQGRNSAGLRVGADAYVLAAIVDTAGYSSALQQSYQAYLITEVPLRVGDKRLAPGAYGFGFVAGDRMVVMDLGGHEVLSVETTRDAQLPRPTPLQILPGAGAGSYRLFLGRSFVALGVEP